MRWSEKQTKLKEIRHRAFLNERLVLDGFHYRNCKFTNVTFEYNGTAMASFSENELFGSQQFSTQSDIVWTTLAILKGFGHLGPNISLLEGPHRDKPKSIGPPIYK